jgi:hypothetical protein
MKKAGIKPINPRKNSTRKADQQNIMPFKALFPAFLNQLFFIVKTI